MIARVIITLLILESLGYAALGTWLLLFKELGFFSVAAILLAVFLSVRIGISLPTYIVATVLRLNSHSPVDFGDTLTAMGKEAWTRSLSFTFVQPFEKWLMAQGPEPKPGAGMPVLLVHGYVCNRGIWRAMRRMLGERVPNALFTASLEPPFARIDDYLPQLAARVDEICDATGSQKIVIIAHSMGGLVTRAYVARVAGTERVARLVTIASPNHGTKMARLGIGRNVRQMYCGNAWLTKLEEDEKHRRGAVPVTCIYSENDDLILPANSCRLPNANNIALRGEGHVSLLYSAHVADLVAQEIIAAN
jgi:triacylglycerol lipase